MELELHALCAPYKKCWTGLLWGAIKQACPVRSSYRHNPGQLQQAQGQQGSLGKAAGAAVLCVHWHCPQAAVPAVRAVPAAMRVVPTAVRTTVCAEPAVPRRTACKPGWVGGLG